MIRYEVIHSAPAGALEKLFRESGFWPADTPDNPEYMARVIAGSAVFAAAVDGDEIIGMARALSDRVSDAFIQDVVVSGRYRRQGIGGKLVLFVAEKLRELGVDWIGLVGVPGTRKFYTELGFEELKEYVAFKLPDPN